MSASTNVRATFDYLRNPPTEIPGEALFYFTEKREASSVRFVSVEMDIFDARDTSESLSLDDQGFCLLDHRSSISDFVDMHDSQKTYEAEMEDLTKRATGAAFAKTFSVNQRFMERPSHFQRTGDDQPARFPHADYTEESAKALISWLQPTSEIYSRSAIYNIWRVFSAPPQDFPLAVCDFNTVSASDEEIVQARIDLNPVAVQESATVLYRHNPDHKWFYFSNMSVDEVIMFKGFDSAPLRSQRVPHSSFLNPAATGEVSPRASVEARVVALFK